MMTGGKSTDRIHRRPFESGLIGLFIKCFTDIWNVFGGMEIKMDLAEAKHKILFWGVGVVSKAAALDGSL